MLALTLKNYDVILLTILAFYQTVNSLSSKEITNKEQSAYAERSWSMTFK